MSNKERITEIYSEMDACEEDLKTLRNGGTLDVIDWKEEDRAFHLKSTLETLNELNKELKKLETSKKITSDKKLFTI